MHDTVKTLIESAVSVLGNSDSPRLDAELLLAHCRGVPRSRLFAHPQEAVAADAIARFRALLARRARGEPLAYLTGEKEFWSLDFTVTHATLIPRPETELLVEQAIARSGPDARILELGTGSGAIAVAVARELPAASVLATDVSEAALAVARENAGRHGVTNVRFAEAQGGDDWYGPATSRRFDVILSNPPYVAENDEGLRSGGIRFEPRAALAAGPEGLDALTRIIEGAGHHLAESGWLLLEHGAQQGQAVRRMMREAGLVDVASARDLAGNERVTAGRRA